MDNSELVGDGYVKLPSIWSDEVPQELNRDMRGFYCDAVASETLSVWRETLNEMSDGLTLNRDPGFGTATPFTLTEIPAPIEDAVRPNIGRGLTKPVTYYTDDYSVESILRSIGYPVIQLTAYGRVIAWRMLNTLDYSHRTRALHAKYMKYYLRTQRGSRPCATNHR